MARLGTVLLVLGVLALGYGALWQFGLAPGSRVTLPPPVALERTTPGTREVAAPTQPPLPTQPAQVPVPAQAPPLSQATPPAAAPVAPTLLPLPTLEPAHLAAADADERAAAQPPETGYAVRLAIPSIKLDTVVQQGGIVQDSDGNPEWETLPFVAVHYGDLTSLIGAPGNAVIAGHVVTLSEGNVFRFLYQLDLDDQVQVWDDHAAEHDFRVVDVKLVPPSDTSVMDQTPSETLTLITCGGTFDPVKREFSDRLVVTARPV
jgi:LPXTG-site transpeptidase (sortase) family protein